MIIRELITVLGFKADTKAVAAYEKAVNNLKKSLGFLTAQATAAGAGWHIERGGLVVLPKGKPSQDKALLLRADTGLIGSPQRTDTGIKIKCLLNPRVTTRRVVRVESREVTGFYMVKSYTHTAENAGDAWYTDIEAVRYDG